MRTHLRKPNQESPTRIACDAVGALKGCLFEVEKLNPNNSPRGNYMKNILVGTAVVAALTLSGLSARASCADPRSSRQETAPLNFNQGPMPNHLGHNAADNIVGTWHVVYTPDGSTTPSGEAFIQWHSDGTEWENINYPVLGGNICLGSWKAVDQSHVSRNHYGWLYTNGVLAGYFNETETDLVAWDGNSYTGANETTLHFFSGPPVVLTGTATATRIAQ